MKGFKYTLLAILVFMCAAHLAVSSVLGSEIQSKAVVEVDTTQGNAFEVDADSLVADASLIAVDQSVTTGAGASAGRRHRRRRRSRRRARRRHRRRARRHHRRRRAHRRRHHRRRRSHRRRARRARRVRHRRIRRRRARRSVQHKVFQPRPPPRPVQAPNARPIITLPPEHKTEVVNIPVNKALEAVTKTDVKQRDRLQTSNSNGRKHALDSLKTQYNAAEAAFRSATPSVISKLTRNLAKIHHRNEGSSLRHRTERITKEAGVHFKNLMDRLKLSRKRLDRARRSHSSWRRRVSKVTKSRKQLTDSYRNMNYANLKRSQAAELAISKFEAEMSGVRRAAKRLSVEKRKLHDRSVKQADTVIRKDEIAQQKINGYDPTTATYTPRFQPESDGTATKTRTLELGKLIDPESHAKGLIENDYAADFGSISRADLLTRVAAETHIDVRNNVAEITEAATYDISPSRVIAELADPKEVSFVEMEADADASRRHRHRRRHRRRHHHRPAPAAAPAAAAGPPLPPIYVKSPPIIHRITNDPNPAVQNAAATAAATFKSSDLRLDNDFNKAREDLLRIHQRNLAQLRVQRDQQIKRTKIEWRKKVLKYNHHPKPSNSQYTRVSLNKLRKRIHSIDTKAAALERRTSNLKSKYNQVSKTFDQSEVRNDGDFKEQDSKIGSLMKKLYANSRAVTSVSSILDKFD